MAISEGSSGEDRAKLVLPQLQLDELLGELQARSEATRGTGDREFVVHSVDGVADGGTVLVWSAPLT